MAAVAALPVVGAVTSVQAAAGWRALDEEHVRRSAVAGIFGEEQVRNAELFAALVTIPTAVLAVLLLVGLVTWRVWAREAVLGVFGLSGAVLVLLAGSGMASDAPRAGRGLAGGLLLLAIAGLAVSPRVALDFDRRRIAAEVRERHRRQAERLAREQERRPHPAA